MAHQRRITAHRLDDSMRELRRAYQDTSTGMHYMPDENRAFIARAHDTGLRVECFATLADYFRAVTAATGSHP